MGSVWSTWCSVENTESGLNILDSGLNNPGWWDDKGGDAIRRLYFGAVQSATDQVSGFVDPLRWLVVDHLCEDLGPHLKFGQIVEVRTTKWVSRKIQHKFYTHADFPATVWVTRPITAAEPGVLAVRVWECNTERGDREIVIDVLRDRDRLAPKGTHVFN